MEENTVFGALGIPYKTTDDGYKYLLLKHESGMWTFPGGGKDEEDTTLEDSLIREIKEEIGLNIEADQLQPTGVVNKFTYGSEKPSRSGKKGETHYWLLKLNGDEKFGSWDKIVDHGWFNANEILELLVLPDMKKSFSEVIKKLRHS